jgi:hypothetical protein
MGGDEVLVRSAFLGLCVCFALAAGAAADGWVLDSILSGDLGTLDLHTEVTFDGQFYHYVYELTATSVVSPINAYTVMNPRGLGFLGPGNAGADIEFLDPEPGPDLVEIGWCNGVLYHGGTAAFYYDSVFGPGGVLTGADGGGLTATGVTLGMVPEPGMISLVGAAWLGLALLRRSKR